MYVWTREHSLLSGEGLSYEESMVALCLRHLTGMWSRGCEVHVRGGVRKRWGEGKGSNDRGHVAMLRWSIYV